MEVAEARPLRRVVADPDRPGLVDLDQQAARRGQVGDAAPPRLDACRRSGTPAVNGPSRTAFVVVAVRAAVAAPGRHGVVADQRPAAVGHRLEPGREPGRRGPHRGSPRAAHPARRADAAAARAGFRTWSSGAVARRSDGLGPPRRPVAIASMVRPGHLAIGARRTQDAAPRSEACLARRSTTAGALRPDPRLDPDVRPPGPAPGPRRRRRQLGRHGPGRDGLCRARRPAAPGRAGHRVRRDGRVRDLRHDAAPEGHGELLGLGDVGRRRRGAGGRRRPALPRAQRDARPAGRPVPAGRRRREAGLHVAVPRQVGRDRLRDRPGDHDHHRAAARAPRDPVLGRRDPRAARGPGRRRPVR